MKHLQVFWKQHGIFVSLLLLGTIIRIIYVTGTPHSVREHDVWGHIDYIRYVSQNWEIPPPHANSQFYHPPLYYFVTATAVPLGEAFGWSDEQILWSIQLFSLALSIGVLAILLWIGRMLIPENQKRHFALYGLIIATFPSLVFFAARINNDVLYAFFAFLGLALIIRYWKTGGWMEWIALSAVIGLGILAKTHVALLLPIAGLCMIVRTHPSWKNKLQRLAVCGLIVIVCGGWFHLLRYVDEGGVRTTVLGNVDVLTNFVNNGPATYLTFNPVEIVKHPFNDPFNDSERRQFFWEYLFRSAFSGEYHLGAERFLAQQIILVTAMLLFPFIIATSIFLIRKHFRHYFPLIVTGVLVVSAAVAFRYIYPYSSAQDFRYSILLLAPLAIAAGTALPKESRVLSHLRSSLIVLLSALFAGMLVSISLA